MRMRVGKGGGGTPGPQGGPLECRELGRRRVAPVGSLVQLVRGERSPEYKFEYEFTGRKQWSRRPSERDVAHRGGAAEPHASWTNGAQIVGKKHAEDE